MPEARSLMTLISQGVVFGSVEMNLCGPLSRAHANVSKINTNTHLSVVHTTCTPSISLLIEIEMWFNWLSHLKEPFVLTASMDCWET